MAYLKNKHLANLKKWNLDISKYKDGVYDGDLSVPNDIKEFKGFEKLFGFEIKEMTGYLTFYYCTSLTSVSNFPEKIGNSLMFYECTSLTSVSNLPRYVGWDLSFWGCVSLTSVSKMPSVVEINIYTTKCPFFENLTEDQIRKKHGILKE